MILIASLHYVLGWTMLGGKIFVWWKIDAMLIIPLAVMFCNYFALSRSYLEVKAKKIYVYSWLTQLIDFDVREIIALNRSRTIRRFATHSVSIELEFADGDRYCVSPIDEKGFIELLLQINPAIVNNVKGSSLN